MRGMQPSYNHALSFTHAALLHDFDMTNKTRGNGDALPFPRNGSYHGIHVMLKALPADLLTTSPPSVTASNSELCNINF